MSAPTIAAIDIGTNSIHMVIARRLEGGAPEVLAREKEPVRLGSGSTDMKTLDADAITRTVEALDRFRQLADAHGAEVVAVATSATREAENQAEFIIRARDEAGVDVSVISGVEEARLIHLGTLGAVPAAGRRHLVIDIGGGSTEFIVGESTSPELVRSLKLGHIRLTDRFFPNGEVEAAAVEACRSYVRSFVAPVAHEIGLMGFELAIGSSGTIENLARMAAIERGETVRTVDNLAMDRGQLRVITQQLVAARDSDDRTAIRGLDAHRADVIVAGAILLEELFDSLAIDEMIVSPAALREGVLFDQFQRRDAAGDVRYHLGDLRWSSVIEVARRFDEDVDHAHHATILALEMFDALQPDHGYGAAERTILEAAGMLHNIGRFVAHAAHHKHSYYLIRNSEHLAGFTEQEIELVAQVARYHRKSHPRRRHQEFAALSEADQQRVRVLAGMLRIGIALDRTYQRSVMRLTACLDDELTISLTTQAGADVELELFTARERAGLLSLALGTKIDFVVNEQGAST